MIRRSRDAKFVIYQVLYIFVITVLALKGAEINLGEVVSKENVVEKSVRDSLITVIDSLSLLGLKFNIEVDKNVIKENQKLKEKLTRLNTQVASLSKVRAEVKKSQLETIKKKEEKIELPFEANVELLQYATNELTNNGNYQLNILDPKDSKLISQIKPGEKKSFELTSQKEIIIKYANNTESIKVNKNYPPEIKIELVTEKMNKDEIYVKDLQRTTCFNVIISDERIEQLKINHSGPISVSKPKKSKKGELVFNVSLKLAASESSFDKWIDRNEHLQDSDGKYKVNFFFTAYDTKSKQKVEVGNSFYFTDYSK